MLTATDAWRRAYPGASIGVLAIHGVSNPKNHPDLDSRMADVETDLRRRYSEGGRPVIRTLPTVQAYTAYYRRFKKTYHVQGQLESVTVKGRNMPRPSALVSAMFAAELDNQLLTAGHDLASIREPVVVGVAAGDESYTMLNGKEQTLTEGDMFIADTDGVMSSIIYGPDKRTPISGDTTDVLFTIYGPEGISTEQITAHLEQIRDYVALVSPDASIETLHVLEA
ncbi:MAG: phenylalanine--tRNA ligase beta subunit-related protein [SAR202 cluster bacterium]|jgi:DNA/RNA-binding domain of Phe-tRNA-synthetase-like protein|nr:phenylalanine--tRNA ligase beta subunit-related protein [SAR202 cluster bacterium]MDP6299701.1 phenylalanine--tRNA ligase beta subunit-related protein [SAR202 cluster bacterium]MDP7102248.1 phenylalanine--tRNA ligase beta subunit-related protein [SAR202 cluster bacterium]MDP7225004.1 phenylalanine--tRNA ligase beta subunit-related protein [SAR202 cluster bacterium]|tara:strand:+ start:911 stop:1585 length:675 start_codon:yes stop_codon:yes gene_type:complete